MRRIVYRKAKRKRNQPVVRYRMHITRGDTVRVVSGDDKGKEGSVLSVNRKKYRVTIEGVNIAKRHIPAPIDASNVMLIDPKSGEPTRIRRKRDKDGALERISVKSGQAIPRA